METLGFVISFATCQPENRSDSCRGALHSAQPAAGLAAQVSAPSEVGFFYLLTARSKEVNDVLT